MPDQAAILDETLELTMDDRGTAVVMDFTGVSGHPENPGSPAIEVTAESVQDAALRFRGQRVTVLNFASGVSPGGGVRFGSCAQEEVLCLASGLLYGLEAHPDYYMKNQEEDAPAECYDMMIWSEDVPLVRDGNFDLIEPMRIQVITYPAPNKYRRAYAGSGAFIDEAQKVFQRRTRHVIRQAEQAGTEVLILGAWGCGAYGNDPVMVARLFKDAVKTQSGSIPRIVFACYGLSVNRNAFLEAFKVGSPVIG